ncbi:flavodoxin family protein [Nocardioides sp. T5]|uniref:flavodoxin family protein n=1 Tax=Nocardioides sp. T5 TaxID=3400182 RepID=UPI003A8BD0F6
MTALVVHESHWGNTRQVAQAIADGLADSHGGPVQVVDVAAAPSPLPDGVDLVVLGGPTHAFSMSRPATRRDAHDRGAEPGHEAPASASGWPPCPPVTPRAPSRPSTRVPSRCAGCPGRRPARPGGSCRATASARWWRPSPSTSPTPPVRSSTASLERARAWGRALASRA